MRKIAHIVNPVIVPQSSDLYVAQPITFETMRVAQENARGIVDVELYSAQFPEDHPLIPKHLCPTPNLERSVLDLATFKQKRKLPILRDILDRLYNATKAEYLIYSNVDIALMPYFYIAVNRLIAEGYDAFTITRRTISNKYTSINDLPLMYAAVGDSHMGDDCLVFKSDRYPEFELENIIIGSLYIGRAMMINLMSFYNNFLDLNNSHLTFHIGDDRKWQHYSNYDYNAFNRLELGKSISNLERKVGPLENNSLIRTALKLFSEKSLQSQGKDSHQPLTYNLSQSKTQNYEDYLEIGKLLHKKFDFDGSIGAFTETIKLASNPSQKVNAIVSRGRVYLSANKLAKALKNAQKAIQIAKNNPKGYFLRGQVHQAQGKLTLAAQDFSKAISLQPNRAQYYIARGKVYEWTDQIELALSDLEKAIELSPKDELTQNQYYRIKLLM